MEHARPTTLLQMLNRRFAVSISGKQRSIADTLGMSDREFAEAEQRGFTNEEVHLIKKAVTALWGELSTPGAPRASAR